MVKYSIRIFTLFTYYGDIRPIIAAHCWRPVMVKRRKRRVALNLLPCYTIAKEKNFRNIFLKKGKDSWNQNIP